MTSPTPFLRTRLSLQMFLQWAVLGAWAPVLGRHLDTLGFAKDDIGAIYSTGALATLIMSLVVGELADRRFSAQKVLAVCFLGTAALLFMAARVSDDPSKFSRMWLCMFGAMIFYGPTPALSNAVSFHHLADARRDFPLVRVWGTVGWIAAALMLGGWMWLSGRPIGDCLNLGGTLAILHAVYCLTLPDTPPRRVTGGLAAFRAIGMLRDPSFAILTGLVFCVTVCSSFVYFRASEFFASMNVGDAALAPVLSVAQVPEIPGILLLPLIYMRWGAKPTIALGIGLWALRYALMASTGHMAVLLIAQGMHGFCFTFTSLGAQIYIERICPRDVRASAQALHGLINGGLGMFAGGYLGGWLIQSATTEAGTDWTFVWQIAAAACGSILLFFLVAFRSRDKSLA